jgi:hypothetical protein
MTGGVSRSVPGSAKVGPECLASCPVAERDGGVFVDVTGLKKRSAPNAATRSLDDLPGPNGWPLVGNMHQLDATKVHLVLEEWAGRYGSIYQFRMGSKRVVATTDPASIEQALRTRPEAFRRSSKMDVVLSEIGIRGVFNAEGEAWRPQRKLSVAALAQRNLRQLYPSLGRPLEQQASLQRAGPGAGILGSSSAVHKVEGEASLRIKLASGLTPDGGIKSKGCFSGESVSIERLRLSQAL